MPKFAVIVPAAGKSHRFKDPHYKKPFAILGGRAVWLHTAERFLNRDDCVQLILVISPEDRETFQQKFGANAAILGVDVVDGGAERADSVEKALAQVQPQAEFIAVHDAARPCIADIWIDRVFAAAAEQGAAMLAIPVRGTLKRVGKQSRIEETMPRENVWEAQTPQVFRRDWLLEAYAQRAGYPATDDSELVERAGHPVTVVNGSPVNLKITNKEDLRLAEQAIRALPKPKLDRPSHPFANDDMWR